MEISKEVEADTQNNCVKSWHIVPLNSFKDTLLWLLNRVTGSVASFYGVRPFLFPSSLQKGSRMKWIAGITDACDRTHQWIRGSTLRGDEFQPPDPNLKTAWVELFHLESEWKSQSSTRAGPCRRPGHLPGHEHYVRNPASTCQGRAGVTFLMGKLCSMQNGITLQILQGDSWSCQSECVFS